jgi:hypothetical protein
MEYIGWVFRKCGIFGMIYRPRTGMKVWQSYLENQTSKARRMYWVYGPNHQEITIIGLEPHPEDEKNGAYERITLSDLG